MYSSLVADGWTIKEPVSTCPALTPFNRDLAFDYLAVVSEVSLEPETSGKIRKLRAVFIDVAVLDVDRLFENWNSCTLSTLPAVRE